MSFLTAPTADMSTPANPTAHATGHIPMPLPTPVPQELIARSIEDAYWAKNSRPRLPGREPPPPSQPGQQPQALTSAPSAADIDAAQILFDMSSGVVPPGRPDSAFGRGLPADLRLPDTGNILYGTHTPRELEAAEGLVTLRQGREACPLTMEASAQPSPPPTPRGDVFSKGAHRYLHSSPPDRRPPVEKPMSTAPHTANERNLPIETSTSAHSAHEDEGEDEGVHDLRDEEKYPQFAMPRPGALPEPERLEYLFGRSRGG